MTLTELRAKNPGLALFETDSPEFAAYGRRVELDTAEILAVGEGVARPETGSAYVASLPELETLAVAGEIKAGIFGTLPTQIGYCHGHNNRLNALEWHASSELNIAVTDLVLILGTRQDVKNGKVDAAALRAFLLHKGEAVEVYGTTLHFCPCEVESTGFGCVVGLPAGTNTALEAPTNVPFLWCKNKWLLAHEENAALLSRGATPGITGINYQIVY